MAQTGYTPISLYYSSTATNIPSAGNLSPGELALNIADGVMYYKNASNAVVPLTSSGVSWQSVQTTSFTAAANKAYPINTTSGAVTVTLPASPLRGQQVGVLDYAGTFATNNLTVNPNGGKIEGSTSNMTLNVNRESITFAYVDSTQGWVPFKSFLALAPQYTASYLIAAGGGGGGGSSGDAVAGGSGAGAGGLLSGSTTLIGGTTYTVVVGAGGAGGAQGSVGAKGSNTTFTGITAAVGGGAGRDADDTNVSISDGGSGGGASGSAGGVAGSGTVGQGNGGGTKNDPAAGSFAGGGGGGAGGAGSGRTAGAGASNSISGSAVTYAAGGTGQGTSNFVNAGVSGSANTGNGGNGALNGSNSGGNGGSGVVILSVPTANYSGVTTGSPTITTSGSNTIISFTASGTYTA